MGNVEKGVDPNTLLKADEKPTSDWDNKREDSPVEEIPNKKEEKSTPPQILSFGQKSVWITFNPSWNTQVTELKNVFASVIDALDMNRQVIVKQWATTPDDALNKNRALELLNNAINEAITAQMWAVKAVTFLK